MRRLTTEEFIQKAEMVHGNTYDYSTVKYNKSLEKVTIWCKTHGIYQQRPNDHLQGYGCPVCGQERTASGKRSSVKVFVNRSIDCHGDLYDYTLVNYKNAITKVDILCKSHGVFKQTPDKHLGGTGCPKCSNNVSRAEKRIMAFLDSNGIAYEREKRFPDLCGYTTNSRLRFDFYIPSHSMLLEYDGEHHFFPVRTKGRIDQLTAEKKHKSTQTNDIKKDNYATVNGFDLIRISYTDFNKIEKILGQLFQSPPLNYP